MRRIDPSVPHRLGRQTYFIPGVQGSSARWAEVMDAAAGPVVRAGVASAAVATTLTAGEDQDPVVGTADMTALTSLTPDEVFAVRRPASHQGMRNYICRVAVPSEAHEVRAVWCESFNELGHLRDLLLARRPRQVSTQPFRLEWVFDSGVRWHIPDFFLLTQDGKKLLVDVTTRAKLEDPRVLAVLQLTAATAKAAGWEYEVRTELPPQRVRNLNFLRACRHDIHQDRAAAVRTLRTAGGTVDVMRAAEVLGGGPCGYQRLWDLLAHGDMHVDLDAPIDIDSLVSCRRAEGRASWVHAF